VDPRGAPPARVRVRARAKINPFLAVRGVRGDGYHELVTVFQAVALADVLEVARDGPPPAAGDAVAVELAHDGGPAVPLDGGNLVLRAAAALAEAAGLRLAPGPEGTPSRVAVRLTKRIPVAGGMAGGSADAAGALLALDAVWGAATPRGALVRVAAGLGADVPFCLAGGTALASGTGTDLAPVLARGRFHWVVCTAAEALPTPEVYAAWDAHCRPGGGAPDEVLGALAAGEPERLGPALRNDLQEAAEVLLPRLRADRAALLDAGALGAVVSGSGPTLLALAADADEAQRIAGRVAGRFERALVTSSPAGGPVVEVLGADDVA
jgi:4-diphosphocytidyl-2-C-methyl-D-erythritol kinase